MKEHLIVCVLLAVGLAAAQEESSSLEAAYRFMQKCDDSNLSLCIKRGVLSFVDDVLVREQTPIVDGITLVHKTPSGRAIEFEKPEKRNEIVDESQIDGVLFNRVGKFFSTSALEFKMPDYAISTIKNFIDEGRKKKKDYLLPFILALKLKAVALVPLVLGAIALLALKALVVGKIALVLSGLIGLQKLLAGQHSTKTVEVVAHPTYSHEEHHGHYRRAFDMAYAAQKP